MQYLLLIYGNEESFGKMSKAEQDGVLQEYGNSPEHCASGHTAVVTNWRPSPPDDGALTSGEQCSAQHGAFHRLAAEGASNWLGFRSPAPTFGG